ncbi:multicopper oxidase family protein [Micromonospora cathayae]|uniref:Multicopper oxidase CueO n=1 Tax=Micromonospora cathayae TaxID=3028804 RepID=A0ABY7ZKG0_9ACTN|nr:multicopper oxidase domain-containing protein [Micromonospora sp. HUAS 3]WDZ83480.1 multicopper oxidase domain-containing protein [Micromonospora sp. HUAS 3]
MPNRRHFLALGVTTGSMLAAGVMHRAAASPTAEPTTADQPFSVPMPVPVTKRPTRTVRGTDLYRMAIKPARVEILPGKTTAVYSYDGQFLGPTIRADLGRPVKVEFTNQLDHPANVHLHGGHVAADSDGFPMDVIEPGQSRTYNYPNLQRGATLWYHDHAHHMEAEHVFRGLHGFYLIEDGSSARLGLPTGAYDVPIMFRDVQFDENGELLYQIERDTILTNGKVQPFFRVGTRRYRFRLLNASTEKGFDLVLGDGEPMTQIASDGGLLPAPLPRTLVRLSAGERQEVVIDFARYPVGTQLVLNDARSGVPVLRFDVVRQEANRRRMPTTLVPLPPMPRATRERDVDFSFDLSGFPVGQVNGKPYDPDRVDFTIKRGSTEIWRIHNSDPDGIDHNFHLHMTHFRVLDRDGAPPLPEDAGLKDTIYVPAGARNIRVQAHFPRYTGKYVFHCHFLEHSSIGMMATMEIVP